MLGHKTNLRKLQKIEITPVFATITIVLNMQINNEETGNYTMKVQYHATQQPMQQRKYLSKVNNKKGDINRIINKTVKM